MFVTAIKYFDSFGSTILVLLFPIGTLISAFIMIKRHWDSIAEAFESEGILGALKRIGLVLLDVIMHPCKDTGLGSGAYWLAWAYKCRWQCRGVSQEYEFSI